MLNIKCSNRVTSHFEECRHHADVTEELNVMKIKPIMAEFKMF